MPTDTIREAAQALCNAWLTTKMLTIGEMDRYVEALREALAEPSLSQRMKAAGFTRRTALRELHEDDAEESAYAAANPLGGPAVVFDAIANHIRLGDPIDAVMRDFGVAWANTAAPQAVEQAARWCSYCGEGVTNTCRGKHVRICPEFGEQVAPDAPATTEQLIELTAYLERKRAERIVSAVGLLADNLPPHRIAPSNDFEVHPVGTGRALAQATAALQALLARSEMEHWPVEQQMARDAIAAAGSLS